MKIKNQNSNFYKEIKNSKYFFLISSFAFDYFIIGYIFFYVFVFIVFLLISIKEREAPIFHIIFLLILLCVPYLNQKVSLYGVHSISSAVHEFYSKNNCLPEDLDELRQAGFNYFPYARINGYKFGYFLSGGNKVNLSWRGEHFSPRFQVIFEGEHGVCVGQF